MEWVNAVALIVVLVFSLHQRKRIKALEKGLASHKDLLASQKELLASQQGLLHRVRAYLDLGVQEKSAGGAATAEEEVLLKKRKELIEEKERFEKEVQDRTKTLEWYDKEFSIGLDALLELLLRVPLGVREPIINRMPNSVMKKGFKRISDREYRN